MAKKRAYALSRAAVGVFGLTGDSHELMVAAATLVSMLSAFASWTWVSSVAGQ